MPAAWASPPSTSVRWRVRSRSTGWGCTGDIQANRVHHGGPDQALYAYSQEDADYWADELQRDMPPGTFGENLRVAGIWTPPAR